MICSNCKSNIPDDSMFCPDCGTPIKNEEELRRKAKEIVTMYPKGYDYFVSIDSLPRFVYNLRIQNCEKIIAKKPEKRNKHNELLQEEKHRQQEQERQKQIEEERRKFLKRQRQQEAERQRQLRKLAEQKQKEDERLMSESRLLRNEIINSNSFTTFALPIGGLVVGLMILIYYTKGDFNILHLPLWFMIWAIATFFCSALFKTGDDTKKIERWKLEHPNDPRNKYL